MTTFILMTKLAPGALQDARGRRMTGQEWLEKVRSNCPAVKWIAHYALLGQYDFMDIYEASSVETAHKVALISLSEGALSAESWEATPYDRFLELLEGIDT